jgi:hypothetical protein
MKNYSKIIADEWNKPVREAQLKTNEHAPVEINNAPTLIHRDAAVRMFKLMQEELWEYLHAYQKEENEITKEDRLIEVLDAVLDMQYILDGIKAQHGFQDIQEEGLDEVHRSNRTKLTGGKMLMSDIGKVLKPDTYEKPQLKDILVK